MDLNAINEKMKVIQDRSNESRRGTFKKASDGAFVLSEDLDAYEELLEYKNYYREYEEFYQKNKEIIDRYNELRKHVQGLPDIAINMGPAEPAPSIVETPTIEPSVEPEERPEISIVVPETPAVESVPEEVVPDRTVEMPVSEAEVEQPVPEPTAEPSVVDESPVIEPVVAEPVQPTVSETPAISEPTVTEIVEAQPAVTEPVVTPEPVVEPVSGPIIEDSTYHMNRSAIIQDLPINDLSEQTFTTPAMTDEQIKASQDLINSVPVIDETQYVDPLQAEIDRLKSEYDSRKGEEVSHVQSEPEEEVVNFRSYQPMTDEEIKASQEKIAPVTPEPTVAPEQTSRPQEAKPAGGSHSGKKVVKKQKYSWKDHFNKNVNRLKGILFKENANNHTSDYMKICQMIANFRVNYKNISEMEANQGLEAIDRVISSSEGLTFDEKKRLYRKLARLAKAVDKLGMKNEIAEMRREFESSLDGAAGIRM